MRSNWGVGPADQRAKTRGPNLDVPVHYIAAHLRPERSEGHSFRSAPVAFGRDVDVAPSIKWIDIALITGTAQLLRRSRIEVASHGIEKQLERAHEEFKEAWKV